MKTLFAAWRVTDLSASLGFYTILGYTVLGKVALDDGGNLAVLAFPDEPSASLELVHRRDDGPVVVSGFDHLAVQVDDLAATLERLSLAGLRPGQIELPAGVDGPRTAWLSDPDGYLIEMVQWPPGHPHGMTAADFPDDDQDSVKEN